MLDTLHAASAGSARPAFQTGLDDLDRLCPDGRLATSALHEILSPDGRSFFFAALLASAALRAADATTADSRGAGGAGGVLIWCDPGGELYPPALAAWGVPLQRLLLVRPDGRDLLWTINECLRCRGVSAVVAPVQRLSQRECRRLQLAAEHGGGAGLLLRPASERNSPYAAATRWLVEAQAGDVRRQRWKATLLHGHGGCSGQAAILEVCRETDHVRAVAELAHRSTAAPAGRLSA